MTDIKSVYRWRVELWYKPALEPNNTDMAFRIYTGEENSKLDCMDNATRLIIEKCKNSDYVLNSVNFEYIGEEL